eukprot:6342083-Amphidinium_carterae.5
MQSRRATFARILQWMARVTSGKWCDCIGVFCLLVAWMNGQQAQSQALGDWPIDHWLKGDVTVDSDPAWQDKDALEVACLSQGNVHRYLSHWNCWILKFTCGVRELEHLPEMAQMGKKTLPPIDRERRVPMVPLTVNARTNRDSYQNN